MRVVYLDIPWLLDEGKRPVPELAGVERQIFEDRYELVIASSSDDATPHDGLPHRSLVGASALVVYRLVITDAVLSVLSPTCRVIARQGVGIDNVRVPHVAECGIWALHVPDYCVDEVSSHALALMLALERKLIPQHREIMSGRWSVYAGGVPRRTADLTLGIVGMGRIGRALLAKSRAIFKSVVVHDPYVHHDVIVGSGAQSTSSLSELFRHSDIVSLHVPLTDDTQELISADVLAHARPGATLVNTARGRVVDSAAVLNSLDSGVLGGFASDVFSPEDPRSEAVNRQLTDRDDVLVSAHRAFLSEASELSLRLRVAEEVRWVLDHDLPPRVGRIA